jgi:hypothetical protein
MALIDKASLLMVPSVYEDGTLYNVLPSGNKAPDETGNHNAYDQTRADFTFSRGSNLAATRVNASGLIEKGRENVFKHSNAFTTSPWSMSATLTSGQADKDGGTNAWLFAKSGLSNSDYYNDTTINGVQTFSIYAKKQSGVGIKPYFFGSVNGYATINLGDGSKYDASGAIIDYKAEAYNDNWWRISVTINASSGNWYIYVTDGTNTQTTTPITIQNAQLEYGLTASSYLDSGATTATAGVLENTPRIDYSSGAGALLLEPQRTNLLANSEYIHGWLNAGGTSSQNSTESTSPEGKYNAAVLDASSVRYLTHSISSATHSYSVYAKAKSGSIIGLRIDTPTTKTTNFDLSNGTISATGSGHTPSIESVGNGWYRCSITFTDSIVNTVLQTTTSGSVYLWGAQLESSASYPSSYVPTYGSAATRGADSCSVTGASDVIPNEGVFYIDMSIEDFENYTSFFQLSEGTNTSIRFWAATYSGSTGLFGQIYVQGVDVKRQLLTETKNERIKAAIRYDSGDIAFYVNGSQLYKGTETFTPEALTIIDNFKLFGNSEVKSGGSVYGLGVFPVLSDSELATLTTL